MTIPLDDPATGYEKQPGEWRRKGENGPPVVTDINGEAVRSGPRKGMAKYVTYSRPSNFGKQVENTFNLERYQQRNGVIGMFLEPSLVDEMAALWAKADHDDQQWKKDVDGVYTKAAKAAGAMLKAERGTHVHGLTESNDLGRSVISQMQDGEDIGLPPAVQEAAVDAWSSLTGAYFDVLVVEAPCIYDPWHVAGTLDRIVRTRIDLTFGDVTIPAGTVIVLDIKTGGLKVGRDGRPDYWSAYAVQIAAYANSVPYDVDTEQRGEWPWPVSTEHAVIAHIDIGGALDTDVMCAQLFYVDLTAGHAAGELVVACKEWQKRRDVFSPEGLYCSTITIDTEDTSCTTKPSSGQRPSTSSSSTRADTATTSTTNSSATSDTTPSSTSETSSIAQSTTRADVVATLGYDHDEGRTLDADSFVDLQALHASLPTEAQQWFHGLTAEADRAGVPFRAKDKKTLRRYELYRGLLLLAQGEMRTSNGK